MKTTWMLALSLAACIDGETVTDTATATGTETSATASTGTDTGVPDATPPTVAITMPTGKDPSFYYDDYDDDLKLWYVDVSLEGMASDPEEGSLSGTSLVWTTDLDVQDATLGTGSPATVRLYSDDCFGVIHTVTLTATDSAGNSASDTVAIRIWTLC